MLGSVHLAPAFVALTVSAVSVTRRDGVQRPRAALPAPQHGVLLQVYSEVEGWVQRENFGAMSYPQLSTSAKGRIGEEICNSAAQIAGSLKAKAIFVYTRTGESAGFVSRRRPSCPIFAVTGARLPSANCIFSGACRSLEFVAWEASIRPSNIAVASRRVCWSHSHHAFF